MKATEEQIRQATADDAVREIQTQGWSVEVRKDKRYKTGISIRKDGRLLNKAELILALESQ